MASTRTVHLVLAASMALSISVHAPPTWARAPEVTGTSLAAHGPAYPLKASTNNRFLVDQNDVPFLMVGDSPQNLVANLSPAQAATYMANRRQYGINALWV